MTTVRLSVMALSSKGLIYRNSLCTAALASSDFFERVIATTLKPSLANLAQNAAPIPGPAPITQHTLETADIVEYSVDAYGAGWLARKSAGPIWL